MITDAQIHLWQIDRPDRPWPKPLRGTPQREGGWSAEQALASMDAIGVDRAVIVPAVVAGDRNEYAMEVAQQYPDRFRIMGRIDNANAEASARLLPAWKQQPGMLGVRLSLGVDQQLEERSLEWLWKGCEEYDIPVMMLPQGGPILERVAEVAEQHPALTIILDHLALKLVGDGTAWNTLDATLALARFPKVNVKVSSVPNFSTQPYPYRDVVPHIKRVYEAYGPRRMFWGSDLTRLRGTYIDCLRLFRDEMDFLSAEDRTWILGRGIAECIGWPEPPASAPR